MTYRLEKNRTPWDGLIDSHTGRIWGPIVAELDRKRPRYGEVFPPPGPQSRADLPHKGGGKKA